MQYAIFQINFPEQSNPTFVAVNVDIAPMPDLSKAGTTHR